LGPWALGIGNSYPCPNGTKKSLKTCVVLFPASRLGMYLKEALPLVKLREAAEPPRMGNQPRGWLPVRARAVSFLSAIHPCPIPHALKLHSASEVEFFIQD